MCGGVGEGMWEDGISYGQYMEVCKRCHVGWGRPGENGARKVCMVSFHCVCPPSLCCYVLKGGRAHRNSLET